MKDSAFASIRRLLICSSLLSAIGCGEESQPGKLGVVFSDSFDSTAWGNPWRSLNPESVEQLPILDGERAVAIGKHAGALCMLPIDGDRIRVTFSYQRAPGEGGPECYVILDDDADLSNGGWFVGVDGGSSMLTMYGPSELRYRDEGHIVPGDTTQLEMSVLFDRGVITVKVWYGGESPAFSQEVPSFHPSFFGILFGRESQTGYLDNFKIEVLE